MTGRNLERLLIFLNNTIDDKRYIGLFNLESLYTLIDVAYTVHLDMEIHIGGAISFGRGMMHCGYGKKNLNAKRSTDAEIVVVSD